MNVKKIILIFAIIVFILVFTYLFYIYKTNSNNIIETGGGLEVAYVKWNCNYNMFPYNVYIKNVEKDQYTKIDNSLIRKYKGENNSEYLRADAIGLKEGDYIFKIIPVVNNVENEKNSIITSPIKVKSNVREGFSFSKNSTNGGNSSGGYNDDGTVPDDAKIIYITKDNINTVKLDITNINNEKKEAIGLCNIINKWNEEAFSKHLIIRILGKIDENDITGLDIQNSAIKVQDATGITIEGVGDDATLNKFGIIVERCSNIEVRNLGIMFFYEDAICVKNSSNIWVHNNDIFYGLDKGEEEDKVKGDGSTDIRESSYVTVSYNHYLNSNKTSLCGLKDDVNYITYHHNWFDHTSQRNPRVRYASVHIYNNYYDGNYSYCIGVANSASVFVEANYFDNCKRPMLVSAQGSDDIRHIMSGEDGGTIKAYNNIIEGKDIYLVYFNEDNTQFDVYFASTRDEKVPDNCKTYRGNNIYNNFDTNTDIMYEYNTEDPRTVRKTIINFAGRLQGGDIKFNTNELSDFSGIRNTDKDKELDDLLKNYETKLISIQLN